MQTINLTHPNKQFIKAVEHESGQTIANCYQCGNCSAGCPMSFSYDISVSGIMRRIQTGQKQAVLESVSLWMCSTCETCTQRCPNNIEVAKIMDVCRHMARRENTGSVYAVKTFLDSFITTIGLHGRIHEIGLMAMYMLRTGRLFTDLDLAPKALPKGKMSILPHRTPAHKEVSGIIKRFKQGLSNEDLVKADLAAKDTLNQQGAHNE